MLITAEGIVLKQRKISNSRRIIVIFTKQYGKISAGTGMNERSKNKSALALRPFTYAEYNIFKNREYNNINGADVKKSYYSIGENVDRFMVASKGLEYIEKLLEEEIPKPRLFDLTIMFLEAISAANANFDTILYAYIVKTFALTGIMPELKRCVNCGETANRKIFSVEAGGVLCDNCSEKLKDTNDNLSVHTTFDIVEVFDFFNNRKLDTFGKIALKPEYLKELKNIINEYVNYYLDINIFNNDLLM